MKYKEIEKVCIIGFAIFLFTIISLDNSFVRRLKTVEYGLTDEQIRWVFKISEGYIIYTTRGLNSLIPYLKGLIPLDVAAKNFAESQGLTTRLARSTLVAFKITGRYQLSQEGYYAITDYLEERLPADKIYRKLLTSDIDDKKARQILEEAQSLFLFQARP